MSCFYSSIATPVLKVLDFYWIYEQLLCDRLWTQLWNSSTREKYLGSLSKLHTFLGIPLSPPSEATPPSWESLVCESSHWWVYHLAQVWAWELLQTMLGGKRPNFQVSYSHWWGWGTTQKMKAINWVTPVPQNIKNSPRKVSNSIRRFPPSLNSHKGIWKTCKECNIKVKINQPTDCLQSAGWYI